jgi:hypothetical protein
MEQECALTPTGEAIAAPQGRAFYLFIIPQSALLALQLVALSRSSSYWLDELFSVVLSKMPLSLFGSEILRDVHPPLYQVLLLPIVRLSDAEWFTRSFSLFAYAASTLLFSKILDFWGQRGRTKWASLLLFTSHPLVYYYSLETRSYELMLLLTIASYLFLLRGQELRFFAALALLSLTHFFGAITACLLGLVYLAQGRSFRMLPRLIVAALPCCAWVISMSVWGGLLDHKDGSFWIKVGTPLESVLIALRGLFPAVSRVYGALHFKFVLLVGAIAVPVVWQFIQFRKRFSIRPLFPELFMLAGIVAASLAIDRVMPISTPRNYLCAVPFLCLALARIVSQIGERRYRVEAWLLAAFVAGNAAFGAFLVLKGKFVPIEDWRASAAFLADEVGCSEARECRYMGHAGRVNDGLNNFYAEKAGIRLVRFEPESFSKEWQLCHRLMVMHMSAESSAARLRAAQLGCHVREFIGGVVIY